MKDRYRIPGTRRSLVFSVREPFISKTSGAEIVHGTIVEDRPLEIISRMPQNGVIFSDGIEEDRLDFNSGAIARHRPGRPHPAPGRARGHARGHPHLDRRP